MHKKLFVHRHKRRRRPRELQPRHLDVAKHVARIDRGVVNVGITRLVEAGLEHLGVGRAGPHNVPRVLRAVLPFLKRNFKMKLYSQSQCKWAIFLIVLSLPW